MTVVVAPLHIARSARAAPRPVLPLSPSALRQRDVTDAADAAQSTDKIISYFSPNPGLINIEIIKN